MIPDRRRVLSNLFDRLYGGSIIRNDLRGELVEEIVGLALAPQWQLCGGDWGACDLRHEASGLTIQVKQSAARQSWVIGTKGSSPPRFSIAVKTGRYEGADWIPGAGRNADIFIFAWHGTTGADCDHADPAQWAFFVVSEAALPAQKSLGLQELARLAQAVDFSGLNAAVLALMPGNSVADGQLAPTVTL